MFADKFVVLSKSDLLNKNHQLNLSSLLENLVKSDDQYLISKDPFQRLTS
jgi:hypothetical protein